jgi:hypothetical protein
MKISLKNQAKYRLAARQSASPPHEYAGPTIAVGRKPEWVGNYPVLAAIRRQKAEKPNVGKAQGGCKSRREANAFRR